ncbi:MAG: lytic murein transglycosylase, partial [Acinetobacter sp.]
MKHYFSFFLGTAFFSFFSQAHAELVINGATFSSSSTAIQNTSTY